MAIVRIDIFDLLDPTPSDVSIVTDALAFVRGDVVYADLLPRQTVKFVETIKPTSSGIHPEALYPGGNNIILRRLRNNDGSIKKYRMMGNFLHETAHGIDRWDLPWAKELEVLDLFVGLPAGTTWRNVPGLKGADEYWKLPYESFCDWWVRGITNGQVISYWEFKRSKIPLVRLNDLIAIVQTPPTFVDKGEVPEVPPPSPVVTEPSMPAMPVVVYPPDVSVSEVVMPLIVNGVKDEYVPVPKGTPFYRPDTLARVTNAAIAGDFECVGRSQDGKYVAVRVRTTKIPGGLSVLYADASRVGVPIVKP